MGAIPITDPYRHHLVVANSRHVAPSSSTSWPQSGGGISGNVTPFQYIVAAVRGWHSGILPTSVTTRTLRKCLHKPRAHTARHQRRPPSQPLGAARALNQHTALHAVCAPTVVPPAAARGFVRAPHSRY
jgi:hypothetical protein